MINHTLAGFLSPSSSLSPRELRESPRECAPGEARPWTCGTYRDVPTVYVPTQELPSHDREKRTMTTDLLRTATAIYAARAVSCGTADVDRATRQRMIDGAVVDAINLIAAVQAMSPRNLTKLSRGRGEHRRDAAS